MIRTSTTLRLPVLLVAVLFGVSLFSCGDADCCSGAGDGQCSSLLCALFAGHDGAKGDEQTAPAVCTCFCQVQTIGQPVSGDIGYYPPVLRAGFDFVVSSSIAPSRSIDHPPLPA